MAKAKWGKDTVAKFLGGQVTFSLSADKSQADYKKDIDGIITRGTDMTPAMEKIGLYLMGATLRNFEAGGRPQWVPLKPATIADRREQGYGAGPILVRSGKLKRSLTKRGAPGQIFQPKPRSLRYGSSLEYFQDHQKGTALIPARMMLVMQKQDRSQVSRIVNRFILTGEA